LTLEVRTNVFVDLDVLTVLHLPLASTLGGTAFAVLDLPSPELLFRLFVRCLRRKY
jgi:hypothetical protein